MEPIPEIGEQADPIFQYQIPEASAPQVYISKLWQAGIGPARGLGPIASRFDTASEWPIDLRSKKCKQGEDEDSDTESIVRPARQNLFAP